jgi:hypothetical protein
VWRFPCNINKEQVYSLRSLRIPVDIKSGPAIVHALLDSGMTGNVIDKSLGTWTVVQDQTGAIFHFACRWYSGVGSYHRRGHYPDCHTNHKELATFDVSCFTKNQLILGMPWLNRHNLVIDFRNRLITFLPKDFTSSTRLKTDSLQPCLLPFFLPICKSQWFDNAAICRVGNETKNNKKYNFQ